MSLAVTGVLSSRASQEHGKRALAAAAHPTRRTVFFASGQVVDEVDSRDGSLVSRILSDLPDPICRLAVSTSDRGHAYLLLFAASNEVRCTTTREPLVYSAAAVVSSGLGNAIKC